MPIANQFLESVPQGNNAIRDQQHATRLFVDSTFRLSPKYTFLFHVAFDLNPSLTSMDKSEILESGMLVKTATLPKFTMDTKILNSYNRVNIAQSKIKYDPVTITFHDDGADIVRKFWFDYMSYYYRDSDYSESKFSEQTKYNQRKDKKWGYNPAAYANGSERLFNSIRLYSLNQHRFTEYTLMNPTITSFQHGEHQNGVSDVMQNTMTVSYETVLYRQGTIVPGVDINFAVLHYDHEQSPISPNWTTNLATNFFGAVNAGQTGLDAQWTHSTLANSKSPFAGLVDLINAPKTTIQDKVISTILNNSSTISKVVFPAIGGVADEVIDFFSQNNGARPDSNSEPKQSLAGYAETGYSFTGDSIVEDASAAVDDYFSSVLSSNGDSIAGSSRSTVTRYNRDVLDNATTTKIR